jgi:hypothetical protein
VQPENPGSMAEAICQLAGDAQARGVMGESGRRFAERELERHAILEHFEHELLLLTGRQRATPSAPTDSLDLQRSK